MAASSKPVCSSPSSANAATSAKLNQPIARISSGVERLDRARDLAAEHALNLVAMHPVAELDQRRHAEPELLDELAPQPGLRLLVVLEPAARQAPLAELLAAARVVLDEQESAAVPQHAAHAVDGDLRARARTGLAQICGDKTH